MKRILTINKQKVEYQLIEDFTYPCPVCGVHGCTGEYFLVTSNKEAIVMERGDLDMLMYDYLSNSIFKNLKQNKYDALPKFLKEYNEATGWNNSDDDEYLIDAVDFIKAIDLIKEGCSNNLLNLCSSLKNMAQKSIDNKLELFIIQY